MDCWQSIPAELGNCVGYTVQIQQNRQVVKKWKIRCNRSEFPLFEIKFFGHKCHARFPLLLQIESSSQVQSASLLPYWYQVFVPGGGFERGLISILARLGLKKSKCSAFRAPVFFGKGANYSHDVIETFGVCDGLTLNYFIIMHTLSSDFSESISEWFPRAEFTMVLKKINMLICNLD